MNSIKEANKTCTTTYPPIVKKVNTIFQGNSVTHHEPTENNPLGQSGMFTFIEDILDIVETAPNSRQAVKDLFTFFENGEI